jgi:hypothetical protein
MTEKLLLIMQVRCNIRAEQREERSDSEWLVTVSDKLKVYRPLVEINAQE